MFNQTLCHSPPTSFYLYVSECLVNIFTVFSLSRNPFRLVKVVSYSCLINDLILSMNSELSLRYHQLIDKDIISFQAYNS